MISRRLIPLFLLRGKRLVKGTQFKDFVDVGDPLSQAMIYDAQGADEIVIVDIDASRQNRLIDTRVITKIISKCRLPIGAGGGIKGLVDARKCFQAGADKVVLNTSAVLKPGLVKELSKEFGSQSVVVSLDVKKDRDGNYGIYIFSGSKKINTRLRDLVQRFIDNGAGELILTSIDKEGSLLGFDLELYKSLRDFIPIPLIASGGGGCYEDIVKLFKDTDCDAVALGKMLSLRDYDMVRIKSYLHGRNILVRDA